MSRSGYTDDCEDMWAHIRWRGAVSSAINGRRGQAFLLEMAAALDAMPVKRLLAVTINTEQGCCAIGAVTKARGIDTSDLDAMHEYDHYEGICGRELAKRVGIAEAMAQEITYWNDECGVRYDANSYKWRKETPEERWTRMREWVEKHIIRGTDADPPAAS